MAALAKVIACVTLICGSFASECEPLLGSSTQTTPNQNAIRNKKNMTLPIVPGGLNAAFELKLADGTEVVVGAIAMFLSKFDADLRQN